MAALFFMLFPAGEKHGPRRAGENEKKQNSSDDGANSPMAQSGSPGNGQHPAGQADRKARPGRKSSLLSWPGSVFFKSTQRWDSDCCAGKEQKNETGNLGGSAGYPP